ncbi:hypothetical protein K438DRAFT_250040 [Mycena galopus ATCC 62051]|nr:hypothetical protein K438DRAFT_250040 [Mycena galopus ATCC 62051]
MPPQREEVEADVRALDKQIDVLSAGLPPIAQTPAAGPKRYDATHIFSHPSADLDLLAQITTLLVLTCNIIIGIAAAQCDFILETVKVIIQVAMSSMAPGHENDTRRDLVLKQLPPYLAAVDAPKIDSPNGARKRGNRDSIRILSAALVDPHEYVQVYFILGPQKPDVDGIDHYSRPLVDVFHIISPTGSSSTGRDVDLTVVLSINDLPAARKMSGIAGTKSNPICTVYKLYYAPNVWDTDFRSRNYRDVSSLRQNTLDWKNASTLRERNQIFKESGVRWPELWRLPYWNSTQMPVIDTMHCVPEYL